MTSKQLNRDQIFEKLTSHYRDQTPKVLKEVAYNLALANTTEANLADRASKALERIKASPPYPENPLKQSAAASNQSRLNVCPICKMGMKTVKNVEGRSMFYCPDHKIAVPHPVQEAEGN
jgi:hypothetical protein